MPRGRNRWLLRVAVPLAVGLAMLGWALGRPESNGLVIENRAGQPIALLRVTNAEQIQTFTDVHVGANSAVRLGSKVAVLVIVEAHFADGTVLRGRFNNVSAGTVLVILPGQIQYRPPSQD